MQSQTLRREKKKQIGNVRVYEAYYMYISIKNEYKQFKKEIYNQNE